MTLQVLRSGATGEVAYVGDPADVRAAIADDHQRDFEARNARIRADPWYAQEVAEAWAQVQRPYGNDAARDQAVAASLRAKVRGLAVNAGRSPQDRFNAETLAWIFAGREEELAEVERLAVDHRTQRPPRPAG